MTEISARPASSADPRRQSETPSATSAAGTAAADSQVSGVAATDGARKPASAAAMPRAEPRITGLRIGKLAIRLSLARPTAFAEFTYPLVGPRVEAG